MNLWADFESENQNLSPSTNRKQTRRLTEQVMLSSIREWLLQDYASAYCRALGTRRIYRRCYWIDGWGGEKAQSSTNGEVSAGKGRRKGEMGMVPPLLRPIVALSKVLAQEDRPIVLQGIVLEGGNSQRKGVGEMKAVSQKELTGGDAISSQVVTSKLVLPKGSGFVKGSWLEVAPALLAEIGQSPAIFLLNPFGQTLFGYDDLALLFQRTSAPTELLLLVPHKQVEVRLLAAARRAAGATELTALLHTDRWKALLPKEGELGESQEVDGVLALLVSMVQQHFLWVQKIAVPIRVRPAVVETAPYTLLFATRSKDSLMNMNDALCVYGRRLVVQSRQGILGEEWFAAQQEERLQEDVRHLYERTLQLGKGQRPRRWPELRQQLLLAHFGQFMVREYDEIINKMLHNGHVRCEWRRRPADGEVLWVPENEDTLLWRR
jgi:hypothetical protein